MRLPLKKPQPTQSQGPDAVACHLTHLQAGCNARKAAARPQLHDLLAQRCPTADLTSPSPCNGNSNGNSDRNDEGGYDQGR